MSEKAYKYYNKNFNKEIIIQKLLNIFKEETKNV